MSVVLDLTNDVSFMKLDVPVFGEYIFKTVLISWFIFFPLMSLICLSFSVLTCLVSHIILSSIRIVMPAFFKFLCLEYFYPRWCLLVMVRFVSWTRAVRMWGANMGNMGSLPGSLE